VICLKDLSSLGSTVEDIGKKRRVIVRRKFLREDRQGNNSYDIIYKVIRQKAKATRIYEVIEKKSHLNNFIFHCSEYGGRRLVLHFLPFLHSRLTCAFRLGSYVVK
jgi:hypothetical protein